MKSSPPSMTRPVLTTSFPCQAMQTTGPAEAIHLTVRCKKEGKRSQ